MEAVPSASAISRASCTTPARAAFYLTSRGITNEVYYAAQKVARFIGTNHVDNSARLCHAASTAAMRTTLGYGAATCSYVDWLQADLIVFFGSNVANNQPVSTKYIAAAKRAGTRVAVVNPYLEPGLDRYWVPSNVESAVFGTRISDVHVPVRPGGDVAFANAVVKRLASRGVIDDLLSMSTISRSKSVRCSTLVASTL